MTHGKAFENLPLCEENWKMQIYKLTVSGSYGPMGKPPSIRSTTMPASLVEKTGAAWASQDYSQFEPSRKRVLTGTAPTLPSSVGSCN